MSSVGSAFGAPEFQDSSHCDSSTSHRNWVVLFGLVLRNKVFRGFCRSGGRGAAVLARDMIISCGLLQCQERWMKKATGKLLRLFEGKPLLEDFSSHFCLSRGCDHESSWLGQGWICRSHFWIRLEMTGVRNCWKFQYLSPHGARSCQLLSQTSTLRRRFRCRMCGSDTERWFPHGVAMQRWWLDCGGSLCQMELLRLNDIILIGLAGKVRSF